MWFWTTWSLEVHANKRKSGSGDFHIFSGESRRTRGIMKQKMRENVHVRMNCYNFNTKNQFVSTSKIMHTMLAVRLLLLLFVVLNSSHQKNSIQWYISSVVNFSDSLNTLNVFVYLWMYCIVLCCLRLSSASMKRKPLPLNGEKSTKYETITITKRQRNGDRWPLKRSNVDFSVLFSNGKKRIEQHEQTEPNQTKTKHTNIHVSFLRNKKDRRTTEHDFFNVNNSVCLVSMHA